jgi:hypothetical protein
MQACSPAVYNPCPANGNEPRAFTLRAHRPPPPSGPRQRAALPAPARRKPRPLLPHTEQPPPPLVQHTLRKYDSDAAWNFVRPFLAALRRPQRPLQAVCWEAGAAAPLQRPHSAAPPAGQQPTRRGPCGARRARPPREHSTRPFVAAAAAAAAAAPMSTPVAPQTHTHTCVSQGRHATNWSPFTVIIPLAYHLKNPHTQR